MAACLPYERFFLSCTVPKHTPLLHLYPAKYILRAVSFLLLTTFFFSNCKKNSDSQTVIDTKPDFNTKVTATLISGFVTDENDAPVENAAVVIGTKIIATDKYGYFEASKTQVLKMAATVTVNKTGYFKAIKTFTATEGRGVFFRIKLIPKKIIGLFNAASGGTVTMPGAFVIKFPAAAITDVTTNKPFTGDVMVTAAIINATDPDLNRIMPGDLRGVNSSNIMQLLTTYGMVAVELSGAGGEFLQITSGKKASINMPIPASLQASAPATIPLWYFDEDKGLWMEEGSATKNGNVYTGEVSHFSFWNWDVPQNYVQLNATFLGSNNLPLQFAFVKVSVVSNPANFGVGLTDTAGFVNGAVPANAQLLLQVYGSFSCSNVIYSQTINTTTANVSLGTVTVPAGNSMATISGSVVNCLNAPVTNGHLIAQSGNYITKFALNNAGNYTGNLMLCNNTPSAFIFTAEDAAAQQQSTPLNYTINSGNNTIPLLQACGLSTQQFLNLTVNGVPNNYTIPPDTIIVYADSLNIGIGFMHPPFVIPGSLSFTSTGIGIGTTQTLTTFRPFGGASLTPSNPPVTVNITEYGSIGQFIAGNFTGVFIGPSPTNTVYNVSASFRVRRRF